MNRHLGTDSQFLLIFNLETPNLLTCIMVQVVHNYVYNNIFINSLGLFQFPVLIDALFATQQHLSKVLRYADILLVI